MYLEYVCIVYDLNYLIRFQKLKILFKLETFSVRIKQKIGKRVGNSKFGYNVACLCMM